VTYYRDCYDVLLPPGGKDHPEHIWISYVPLERVQADIRELACVEEHRVLLAPRAGWECLKVGAGAPAVWLAAALPWRGARGGERAATDRRDGHRLDL